MLRSKYFLRQIVLLWLVGVVLLPLLLQFINRPSNINNVSQPLLSDSAHQDDDESVQQQTTTVDEIEMETIQLERKNSLQENCLSPIDETTVPASITSDPLLEPEIKAITGRKIPAVIFIIDDKHRTMYCDVPKVASTNLKRLMLVLSGAVVLNTTDLSSIPKGKVHNRNPMRTLNAKHFNDTLVVGDNYTKFFFVRHPFERLVSAYQNKLASNNTIFNKMVGKKIIRKYRQNATAISLNKGHDVTFNEFVQFIVDEWRNGSKTLDAHWRPIVDLCLPCVMQYDFIGKFETLNRDVEYLLRRKWNESQWIGLFDSQPKAKTTSSLWKQTMKLISAEQLSQLNEVYDQDFRLFQYPHYYETTTQPLDDQSFHENEYI